MKIQHLLTVGLVLGLSQQPGLLLSQDQAALHIQPHNNARTLVGLRHFALTIDRQFHLTADENKKITWVYDDAAAKTVSLGTELRLRIAGIAFEERPYAEEGVPPGEQLVPAYQNHDIPVLFMKIDKQEIDKKGDMYIVIPEVYEKALLVRDPKLSATVKSWMGDPGTGFSLAEATIQAIDGFCNEYLKANPKK